MKNTLSNNGLNNARTTIKQIRQVFGQCAFVKLLFTSISVHDWPNNKVQTMPAAFVNNWKANNNIVDTKQLISQRSISISWVAMASNSVMADNVVLRHFSGFSGYSIGALYEPNGNASYMTKFNYLINQL